ncbi:MAG: hypothetical protein V4706_13210 [Pseudomonadota bacterium]
MKVAGRIAGLMMVVLGTVWFLQGINVLPGSFMTGQTQWAIYGGLLWLAGLALMVICRTGRTPKRPDPGGKPPQP